MTAGEKVIRERIDEARRMVARAVRSKFKRTRYETDDMIGNAMVFLLENARYYDPQKAKLSTWCYRAAELAVLRMMQFDGADRAKTLDEAISLSTPIRSPKIRADRRFHDGLELADAIEDRTQDTERDAVRAADFEKALRVIRALPNERMTKILMERYATDGEPKTFDELAAEFGVSKERVRQIEMNALWYVRFCMGVQEKAKKKP